jgi:hypothetical protein
MLLRLENAPGKPLGGFSSYRWTGIESAAFSWLAPFMNLASSRHVKVE